MRSIYLSFIFLFGTIFLSSTQTFAMENPVSSISFWINTFTCPDGAELGICGGGNAELHNKWITAMKQKSVDKAIKYWDAMTETLDWTDNMSMENTLLEPLFGTYAPEWTQVLPTRILSKKTYKWGIITVGNNCIGDCDVTLYFFSFMRYKKTAQWDMLYIYNVPLAPKNSKQYVSYNKLYNFFASTEVDFSTFDKDIIQAFRKGKFNNKDTNKVYQDLIKSIK